MVGLRMTLNTGIYCDKIVIDPSVKHLLDYNFIIIKHGKLAISATNIVRLFFFASSIIVL